MPDFRGKAHDAFIAAVESKRPRQALARALSLTEGTLTLAVRAMTIDGDQGDRGALLAVAVRLFPGPYSAADLLNVGAGSLALYGEALLAGLGRPV
ncbi:MAG: hypothetical protein ACI8RZ_003782 [Myxococcota bacterium]|jgi:hypothetical protein